MTFVALSIGSGSLIATATHASPFLRPLNESPPVSKVSCFVLISSHCRCPALLHCSIRTRNPLPENPRRRSLHTYFLTTPWRSLRQRLTRRTRQHVVGSWR